MPMSLGLGIGLVHGGAASFSPIILSPSGWWDPSDLTTLSQDTAGATPVTALEQPVGRMTDKSGNARHFTQSTSAARPVVSARVNLFTKTQDFSHSDWAKVTGATIDPNVTTAPDGTMTADRYTGGGSAPTFCRQDRACANGQHKLSFVFKADSNHLCFIGDVNIGGLATFNLTNGTSTGTGSSISSLGNGWWRCSVVYTPIGNFVRAVFGAGATYSAGGAGSIFVWGADARSSSDILGLSEYQFVDTSTVYNSTGFPVFLLGDGVDDFMEMNANFSTIITASQYELCIAGRFLTVATDNSDPSLNDVLFSGGSGAVAFGAAGARTSNAINGWNNDGSFDTASLSMTHPKTFVWQQRHDTGNLIASYDQNSEVSVASGDTASVTITPRIFQDFSGGEANARLYGMLVRATLLTASERTLILNWMNGKAKAF